MGKATEDLVNEHEAILHVLTIVDQLLSSDKAGDDEILKFGNELVISFKSLQINATMEKKRISCLQN